MRDNAEAELLVPDDTADFISRGCSDDGNRQALPQRSCCCTSRPTIRVLVPLQSDPSDRVDLLLCGHHFRASRPALARISASVVYLGGESW